MSGKRSSVAIKKAQYYVWYLGWKECRGLGGREFTEPIAKQMVARRRGEVLPKLTIEVSKKELKIVQLVDTKKGKVDKLKYPPVQARDVTYATQTLSPDEDVVSCIYLGYNPNTKGAVHVHVYRCDSVETARLFVEHVNLLITIPEHVDRARRIEQELAAKGQVVPRPGVMKDDEDDVFPMMPAPAPENQPPHHPSSTYAPAPAPVSARMQQQQPPQHTLHEPRVVHSPRDRSPVVPSNKVPPQIFSSRENDMNGVYGNQGVYRQTSNGNRHSSENDYGYMDEETASQYDSLAEELRKKLGKKPLLLPPKDYDTINRSRGNQFDLQNRHCKNSLILGKNQGDKLESTATDSARGDSENSQDGGDLDNHSPNEPSPRSLKSSGRFSGGFFDSSRDDDVDAELAGMPSISDPAFFQPERPFSPGPNTQDLRSSYFPGDQALPGYMPNGKQATPRDGPYSPRGSQTVDREQRRGGAKYSASSLGLAAPPTHQPSILRQRSQDEGYTSLERGINPNQFISQQDLRGGPGSIPSGPADYATRQNAARRLRRSEEYEEPPIDYTIAVRKNNRLSRPSFH